MEKAFINTDSMRNVEQIDYLFFHGNGLFKDRLYECAGKYTAVVQRKVGFHSLKKEFFKCNAYNLNEMTTVMI